MRTGLETCIQQMDLPHADGHTGGLTPNCSVNCSVSYNSLLGAVVLLPGESQKPLCLDLRLVRGRAQEEVVFRFLVSSSSILLLHLSVPSRPHLSPGEGMRDVG